ncbi:PREDICTED: uncharacterized protein LOC109114224 [Nelumbo nucifera]|uniref:Uncharacterized protein LOC109114224 n=1 Tax=Nelumbo nucifera TaxID=4432 RepID=A0A1U8PZY5_NELNU|nr:PREDICTED: uncharacterized protein LOC109114224 [Nelumbo nucifera]
MEGCKTAATPLVTNERFKKEDGPKKADASIYRRLIGSLLYLIATRLDIMYATSLLLRFRQSPSQVHYGATKRILRYLQGTKEYGIWYKSTTNSRLIGYTNSDWAGSVDDMKNLRLCLLTRIWNILLGIKEVSHSSTIINRS